MKDFVVASADKLTTTQTNTVSYSSSSFGFFSPVLIHFLQMYNPCTRGDINSRRLLNEILITFFNNIYANETDEFTNRLDRDKLRRFYKNQILVFCFLFFVLLLEKSLENIKDRLGSVLTVHTTV